MAASRLIVRAQAQTQSRSDDRPPPPGEAKGGGRLNKGLEHRLIKSQATRFASLPPQPRRQSSALVAMSKPSWFCVVLRRRRCGTLRRLVYCQQSPVRQKRSGRTLRRIANRDVKPRRTNVQYQSDHFQIRHSPMHRAQSHCGHVFVRRQVQTEFWLPSLSVSLARWAARSCERLLR